MSAVKKTIAAVRTPVRIAMKALLLGVALVLSPLVVAQSVPSDALTVDATGHWFKYKNTNQYRFMAGAGGPEDFLFLPPDRQQYVANSILSSGSNVLYIQAIRSHGGDGQFNHNPFINFDATKGVDLNVLKKWDGVLAPIEQAGVIILFYVYDDSATPWGCNAAISALEADYIKTLVNYFKKYRNLVWVTREENRMGSCSESLDDQKMANIAAEIRKWDTVHPVSVHHNNEQAWNFAGNANINVFSQQTCQAYPGGNWDDLPATYFNQGGSQKEAFGDYVYIMAECFPFHNRLLSASMNGQDAERPRYIARTHTWGTIMAGGYPLFHFTFEDINVSRDEMANLILTDQGKAIKFLESIPFYTLQPLNTRAKSNTDFVLGNAQTQKFLLYGYDDVISLGISALPVGQYKLQWFNPETGTVTNQTRQFTSQKDRSFKVPTGFPQDVVLYLSKI
jgi:hypothetical protein